MIAIRGLPRAVIMERLLIYGCRHLKDLDDGTELWETGWDEPFTLVPDENGQYDEWQYFQLVARVIGKTMPSDWNDKNGKK